MQKFGNESGQTLIVVALSMSVLLGFTAFATDIGVLLHQKRVAQTAADSAAIAAAERLGSGAAAAQAAAQEDAASNGFTNGQNGATVTVTLSPGPGSFTGSHYVQVTVAQSVHTVFAGLFGYSGMNVSARATAGDGFPSLNCVYVLSPNADLAMNLQGSFDVSTPGCGVLVNSSKPDALNFVGGSGDLKSSFVNVVGGDSGQTQDSTTKPTLGVAQITDPLAYLDLPQYAPTSACPSVSTLSGPLSAGCWSATGSTLTLSNATLSSGTYFFQLTATQNLVLTGNVGVAPNANVTLYLTNGGISATTNSTLNLVAPTASGPFQGIVAYIEPPPSTQTQAQVLEVAMGNATGVVDGIIYAPGAQLFIHDSGGDKSGGTSTGTTLNLTTDFVVNTFLDQTGNLTVLGYSQTQLVSPLNRVTLVQ
jgi:hypothetical protein